MYVSPFFVQALRNELASGRYPVGALPNVPLSTHGVELWLNGAHFEGFVVDALRSSSDPALGLVLAERAPLTLLHVLGHLLLECASLAEAFKMLTTYSGALFEGMRWHLIERGPHAEVGFRQELGLCEDAARFWSEYMLGLIVRTGTALSGCSPVQIGCGHRAPAYAARYADVYGCPVGFGELSHWVRFPAHALNREIAHRDPALFCLLRDTAEHALRRRTHMRSVSARVREALSREENLARVDMKRLVRSLSMTGRSLRRRLQQEGRTMTQLIDDVRCDWAKRALLEGESVSTIVSRLGYSEPSAFHRAFRRWTGQTPGQFRRSRYAVGALERSELATRPVNRGAPSAPRAVDNRAPVRAGGTSYRAGASV